MANFIKATKFIAYLWSISARKGRGGGQIPKTPPPLATQPRLHKIYKNLRDVITKHPQISHKIVKKKKLENFISNVIETAIVGKREKYLNSTVSSLAKWKLFIVFRYAAKLAFFDSTKNVWITESIAPSGGVREMKNFIAQWWSTISFRDELFRAAIIRFSSNWTFSFVVAREQSCTIAEQHQRLSSRFKRHFSIIRTSQSIQP